MHDIFAIKELLQHILSFVPRKLIILSALTCKNFHDAITIDYNQESVAKNSDMFSLHKIPYSAKAMINIAKKYNNNIMIGYLLEQNVNLLDDSSICQIIGYIGDEYLLNKISSDNLSFAVIGICEGSHINLFEKYKDYLSYNCHIFYVVKYAYKMECVAMINAVNRYIIKNYPNNLDNNEYGEIVGLCSRKSEKDVLLYIKNFMLTDKFNMDVDYIPDYIYCICDGLIEGEHYDTFVWFTNEEIVKQRGGYFCDSSEIMGILIKNNNFKMFQYVLLNNCRKWQYKDYYISLNKWTYDIDDHIDHHELVDYCIEYKRIEILTFLINHIRFNLTRYQEFVNKSQLLQFDGVTDVFITNKHLFIDYVE